MTTTDGPRVRMKGRRREYPARIRVAKDHPWIKFTEYHDGRHWWVIDWKYWEPVNAAAESLRARTEVWE